MIITYYGGEFLKVQTGDTTLVFNPFGKDSSFAHDKKSPRFGADVVFVSVNDKDFNVVGQLLHGEKDPFVISGPGEYEVKGVFIKGFITETTYSGKKRINTIYSVLCDGIHLCFLGALGSLDSVTSEIKGSIGGPDILFVPIGGGDVLSPSSAGKISLAFVPKVIIPMHYDEKNGKSSLRTFLGEEGRKKVDPLDKLVIKKKDLEEKVGEIVVLKAQ
ncbi:MAG: MBL fold metallo-hydrolase [Patescibacteria group bacterium]|nr:MAG: MBL fold metallo-hydrolase [Patescibacteria group bacterium]